MDLSSNTFDIFIKELKLGNETYKFFDISKINEDKYSLLPYSIRVILESAVRNCDESQITSKDIKNILNWPETHRNNVEIPFLPSRVILQDFTGIPAIVDLAAIRESVQRNGFDPKLIKPNCPVDLVIDNSLQSDISRKLIVANPTVTDDIRLQSKQMKRPNFPSTQQQQQTDSNQILVESVYKECPFHLIRTECADTLERNQNLEFERSQERFQLLKWSSNVFDDVNIIPPGSGIAHQVNLEYLARVVFNKNNLLYPDSLIGTDSHTTMVNGIGVVGWGVGGIETESVMLGQAITMILPQVIGYKIIGNLNELCTSTDVVLTIIKSLRQLGVSNKFVEFFGPGVNQLSISDRETIANMSPEYGAVIGYFAADELVIQHLIQTGRNKETIEHIKEYLIAVRLFRDYNNDTENTPIFTDVYELDLSSVLPCVSGPKRTLDKTIVSELKKEFKKCLTVKNVQNGYGLKPEDENKEVKINYENQDYILKHGSVLIAAINSCTNNSNPSAMLAAGILAKKATDLGLQIKPYIKTSLSPGSGVVTEYLIKSGLLPSLEHLGFKINGYGCLKCIENISSIDEKISQIVEKNNLITVGVLSGNRNFEGRIHPTTKANYLASPPLAIAFALAGRIDIDFDQEPIGYHTATNKNVYLKDIWPTRKELQNLETNYILPEIYLKLNEKKTDINQWASLKSSYNDLFPFDSNSTYIKFPPFFNQMKVDLNPLDSIKNAHCLLYLGDSITTDHISPAGSIARMSPAAKYLTEKGLVPREFNSYGARRGNDAVMSRGTFANIRLFNKILDQVAAKTVHFPTGKQLDIYDAAELYKNENIPLIIIAGKDYGTGSSRDWAAKGQSMLGIKAIIAESFDRVHRSNLIGMGIIPLQFLDGENAKLFKLTGRERFTIYLNDDLTAKQIVDVETNNGIKFKLQVRIDSNVELNYIKNGGLLHYLVRKFL